jgi:prepilin-type N-terminal cleavage/methylation domain-containing protein
MHTTRNCRQCAATCGFTLIEFAIGMFLMSVLLSAILTPLTAQIEQRKVNETQSSLAQITDALMGFATAHGYLPCPDRTSGPGANDGIEDLNAGTTNCAVAEGNLPWVTLGIGGTDAWGNLFSVYRPRQPVPSDVRRHTQRAVSRRRLRHRNDVHQHRPGHRAVARPQRLRRHQRADTHGQHRADQQ